MERFIRAIAVVLMLAGVVGYVVVISAIVKQLNNGKIEKVIKGVSK